MLWGENPIPNRTPQNQGWNFKKQYYYCDSTCEPVLRKLEKSTFSKLNRNFSVKLFPPHPPAYKFPQGFTGMMQTAGNSPHCLSSHTSTSSKSCVGNRSLETQSQPFPACFSHLFLTACSCHLDLSGLDLVIPDVVWHFQFIRNAFVYLLGGVFFSFFSFFHVFSFSLGCVEAFCLGCQCKRPLPCREVPPTPVLSEIRTVISPVSSTLSGLGAVIEQKGRLIMFLYFSVFFYHFIIKQGF